MNEGIIRAVSLFFYLNLFDTKQSFLAAQRTLSRWRHLHSGSNADVIRIARKVLEQTHQFKFFAPHDLTGEFQVPTEVRFQPWLEFQKRSDPAEVETVLWSQVLGFSDDDIALGMDVSVGTVRHRLNRGLRQLGHFS